MRGSTGAGSGAWTTRWATSTASARRAPGPADRHQIRVGGSKQLASHSSSPGLFDAVVSLSEAQRVAVVLVHGFEWTLREVAELTGVTVSTVQTHVDRALAKLRAALEVADDA